MTFFSQTTLFKAHKLTILLTKLTFFLFTKTLPSILNNTNQRIKQDINEVTFGYNITRDEELIDFKKTMDEVYNKIYVYKII